jgi:peptide/nickel transport system permease protein
MLRRILALCATLWLAATAAFFLLRVVPGNALEAQLAQGGASTAQIAAEINAQGLNDSVLTQYIRYMGDLLRGDLGFSYITTLPVKEMIAPRLWPTVELAIAALSIALISGLIFGVVAAGRGFAALGAQTIISLGLSTPIYWTGTLAIALFTGLPASGTGGGRFLILPAGTLAFHIMAPIAQVTAATVRDLQAAPFVRTAHSKGLSPRTVWQRHILRVALPSILPVVGLQSGFVLGGTIIIESVFVRSGIGQLMLDSTVQQDYPVVQGLVILGAATYLLITTLSDLCARWFDPRLS